jgi:hypothetical protein
LIARRGVAHVWTIVGADVAREPELFIDESDGAKERSGL